MRRPGQSVVEPSKAKEAEFLETAFRLGPGFSTAVDIATFEIDAEVIQGKKAVRFIYPCSNLWYMSFYDV